MTNWTVRVDWLDHAGGPNEAELEELLDKLADLHPAINLEHGEPNYPICMSATISLDAGSLRQATAAALQSVEAAAGQKANGLEVLATHEYDRRAEAPSIPELVGNADIADLLGVTRQRVAQLDASPGFPPAVAHIKAGPLRVRRQVEQWATTWERRSGPKRKVTTPE